VDAPAIQYTRTDDGLSIAYWAIGDGPTLILSHPTTMSHVEQEWRTTYLREFYAALARHFRVVRFDQRGCGLSDRSPAGYSGGGDSLDLDAVLRAIGPEPAILASMFQVGIPVLLALAAPERVSHLVLWSPVARGADYEDLPSTKLSRELRAVDPVLGTEAFITLMVGLGEGERAQEFAELVQRSAANTDDGVRSASYDFDVVDRLAEVAVPTLVLQPSESRMVPANLARQVAAGIPGAEFVVIEGQGSLPWVGHVEAYVAHIRRFVLGEHAEATAGDTQTILFTDLAASTAITQRLGDAGAQELVRAHNAIVRAALAANSGHEVKHTGDGIFAWFPAASNGLDCARAIQQGVTNLANPDLGVKIGLNAGEPIVEEDDLYGTAVQIAARATNQAEAGEIVCTNVVRELVAGKSYLFAEREHAAMKGVEEPVRLFTVRVGD
jgi:class 3 adenylate cyclase